MPRYLTMAASTALTLTLLSFAGAAIAAPVPALDRAASLMVLTGDEENAEVKNLLDPEADAGAPKDGTPAAPPEGEHAAAPEGGDSAERALESTVGGDGINAIQRESIPEKGNY